MLCVCVCVWGRADDKPDEHVTEDACAAYSRSGAALSHHKTLLFTRTGRMHTGSMKATKKREHDNGIAKGQLALETQKLPC